MSNEAAADWRSSDLTKDYRCKIFGIFILVWIIFVIFFAIAAFFDDLIFGTKLLRNILFAIVLTPPLTFLNVLPSVIYFRLRVVKENLLPEDLAGIFD